MNIGIMNTDYDTWVSEEDLLSLNNEDVTWFKEEIGLSREDLFVLSQGRRSSRGNSSRAKS